MLNQTKDVVLVAPLGNPTRRPRLHKFIEILNDDGGVEFWGWARSEVDRVAGQATLSQRNILYGGWL